MTLLLITGSTRAASTNTAALRAIAENLPDAELYGGLGVLPQFNPDDDVEPLHPAVADLRARLARASALLFCTPEYAGALPGSLKNLLDWAIGGGELSQLPVAWINCSAAVTAAAGAHAELRTVLRYADTVLIEDACAHVPVTRPDLGPDGAITDPELVGRLVAVARALLRSAGGNAAGKSS